MVRTLSWTLPLFALLPQFPPGGLLYFKMLNFLFSVSPLRSPLSMCTYGHKHRHATTLESWQSFNVQEWFCFSTPRVLSIKLGASALVSKCLLVLSNVPDSLFILIHVHFIMIQKTRKKINWSLAHRIYMNKRMTFLHRNVTVTNIASAKSP